MVQCFLIEGIPAVSNLKMTLQGMPLNIYVFLYIYNTFVHIYTYSHTYFFYLHYSLAKDSYISDY